VTLLTELAREESVAQSRRASFNYLGKLLRDKSGLIGFILVIIYTATAATVSISDIFRFTVTPYNPLQQNVGPPLAAPSLTHPFGTDMYGRDVFSRIIAATPNELVVSVSVVVSALIIGTLLGSYSASAGGLIDEALMRITDIFFAIPALVLAMAIGLVLGGGLINMMIAIIIIWWPPYARLARGETFKVIHQNYIEAARISGLGRAGIIFKHVIPNIAATVLMYATLDMGTVILTYSGLSYLGLAVPPPYPDWGRMVSSYQDYLLEAPWLPVFPGVAIALIVIGFSLLGDGIRNISERY
jgi:peptide/nickel transport system permease protein